MSMAMSRIISIDMMMIRRLIIMMIMSLIRRLIMSLIRRLIPRRCRSRQVVLRVEMHWRQRLGVAHLLFIGMSILTTTIEELTEGLYKAEGRREDGAIREPSRQSRWSRGLELERSRWSRGREVERSRWSRGDGGNVVVEDGSSLSRSIILIL